MRRSLPRLAAAAVLLALAGPVPSAAGATWSAPETVSEAGSFRHIGGPSIAMSGSRALIAWERYDPGNEIRAARAGSGAFGRSFALQSQERPLYLEPDGSSAVDSRGNGFLAYQRWVRGNLRIEYAVVRPNGSRTEPDLLSGAGDSAFEPTFVTAADQPPVLAWWRRTADRVQLATFAGAMQAPVATLTLPGSTTAGYAQESDGTLDAAIAAGGHVQLVRRAPGSSRRGDFGQATMVSAGSGVVRDPQIAVGPSGAATIVWRQFVGVTYRLMAATRPDATAPFSAPRELTGAEIRASEPQVVVTSGGDPMVTYFAAPPGNGSGSNGLLHLRNLRSGSDRVLSRHRVSNVALAADGADRVTVAWRVATPSVAGVIQSVTTARSSTAGTVRTLTGKGERASWGPSLASAAPAVGFRLAWTSSGGKIRAIRR